MSLHSKIAIRLFGCQFNLSLSKFIKLLIAAIFALHTGFAENTGLAESIGITVFARKLSCQIRGITMSKNGRELKLSTAA